MRKGIGITVVAASVMLAFVAGGVVGRATVPVKVSVSDARAYAMDRGDLTLADALQRAAIALPACQEDSLRYAVLDDGGGYWRPAYVTIYLRLAPSESCMDEFLASNHMVSSSGQQDRVGSADSEKPIGEVSLAGMTNGWPTQDVMKRLGWKIDSSDRFQSFGVTTDQSYMADVLIQHTGTGAEVVLAYVYGARVA